MSSIKNIWLKDHSFARSMLRKIDDETLIDLLAIVEFESNKLIHLEDIGIQINGCAYECLFDYVLDAIGVPQADGNFDRKPFEKIFYDDYLDGDKFNNLLDVLSALRVLTEESNQRMLRAKMLRLTVVDLKNPNDSNC